MISKFSFHGSAKVSVKYLKYAQNFLKYLSNIYLNCSENFRKIYLYDVCNRNSVVYYFKKIRKVLRVPTKKSKERL